MSIHVFEQFQHPLGELEVFDVDRLLMLLVDLLGGGELEEVVVASEVLVVDPDVSEGYPHLLLVELRDLLVEVAPLRGG